MIADRFADFLNRLRGGTSSAERQRLAAILGLNRALAAAQDLSGLLQLLLDEAVRLFGAERGFVVLGDVDGSIRVAAARSLDREPIRSPLQKISRTVVQQCLDRRAGVFCEDAREGDFAVVESIADLKLRSVLCMPLFAGDQGLGCVYLDHRFQSGVFQEADLPWFQAFADQGAIALHLHQLIEANRQHAARVEEQNRGLQETVKSQAAALHRFQPVSRGELQHAYDEITGTSPALLHFLHLLDRVVGSGFPVLLSGESGTGKELAARALHRYGANGPEAPFVAVNVAAVNPNLLESELFGHVRGAFTGADQDRTGLLRDADGGVLFLDEVTEMDLDLQVKLLRFLEASEVRAVGADVTRTVQVRIVAATNRDALAEVEAGRFRRDLYYRLAVMPIEVPPLRERREDVPVLVDQFFREAAVLRGGAPVRPTAALIRGLVQRSWPGNIRQLRNEVLRLDAMADDGVADLDLLPPEATAAETGVLDLATLEAQAIRNAMRVAAGNKAEAARLLGISRRALYNKLDRMEDSGE